MNVRTCSYAGVCLSLALTGLTSSAGQRPAPAGTPYIPLPLVSDLAGLAPRTDPHLVNPWGVAAGDDTALWVNDNGTGVSTIYHGNGAIVPLVVTIPAPPGSTDPSAPTGIVYSDAGEENPSAFAVTGSNGTGPAKFIFDTEDGTISGWSPAANVTNAILTVDNSASGASYKGLGIVDDHIYASNFATGQVEIYDSSWQLVGSFTGPNVPSDYAPFGVQNIDDQVVVTFAVRGATGDDVAGPGNGIVDVFDTNGTFVRELTAHGALNSPWGLALAPSNFGRFSNALLVGNFGDGTINAYDFESGAFLGTLTGPAGAPVVIEGLWGLIFGNGSASGRTNSLYFTAGIQDEAHGLLGLIRNTSKRF